MKSKNKIIDTIFLIIGSFIIAVSVNVFLSPNKISTGGASGVGIILYHIFNIPISLSVLLINLPLFIICLKNLGLKFCIKAIVGTILLVIFLGLTSDFSKHINIEKDMVIGSIFGGLFMGIGLSLVFKADGSTGGSDLLAQIIYNKRPISSIGQILLVIDSAIIISNAIFFNNILTAFYSVLALYISKQTTDIIFEGVNYTKAVNIITKKGSKIADEIIEKTGRGVTISNCIGVYTKEEYIHIISVVTVPQLPKVKKIVRNIDKEAFIYISNTNEVLGLGFKENR